nr:hypothetical protein [Sphingopyxis sp. 113P3]
MLEMFSDTLDMGSAELPGPSLITRKDGSGNRTKFARVTTPDSREPELRPKHMDADLRNQARKLGISRHLANRPEKTAPSRNEGRIPTCRKRFLEFFSYFRKRVRRRARSDIARCAPSREIEQYLGDLEGLDTLINIETCDRGTPIGRNLDHTPPRQFLESDANGLPSRPKTKAKIRFDKPLSRKNLPELQTRQNAVRNEAGDFDLTGFASFIGPNWSGCRAHGQS